MDRFLETHFDHYNVLIRKPYTYLWLHSVPVGCMKTSLTTYHRSTT